MKVEKTEKRIVEQEIVIESYTVCDRCNEKIVKNGFDQFHCRIEYKTGFQYPEGGNGDISTVDLCQDCADDLITLLKENGYRINENEWDW